MNDRFACGLFVLGMGLFLLAWSPLSIAGQGYSAENIAAASRLVGLGGIEDGKPTATWPRHGPVEPLLYAPFVALSRLLPGDENVRADELLSLLPIAATACILWIVYLWSRRLGAKALPALGVAFAIGLGTELWPYAYVGLETTQSLALLAAGYLALGVRKPRAWPQVLLFGAVAAVAISAKATGAVLLPAVLYLAHRVIRAPSLRIPRGQAFAALAVLLVGSLVLAALARAEYWQSRNLGGQVGQLGALLVPSPLDLVFNLLQLVFGSNKGLAVFAPPAIVGILAWPALHRRSPATARFVGLTAAGLALGFASISFWSDETWGPRYLHTAIAPLGLSLAVAVAPAHSRRWRRALAVAAVLGLLISGLGVLFYWGSLHQAAMRAKAATLEGLQHDPAWNAVRFDAALLRCWAVHDCRAWPPRHRWYDFSSPPPAAGGPTVGLAEYAHPQPLILRPEGNRGAGERAVWLLRLALGCGLGLLFLAIRGASPKSGREGSKVERR